MLISIWFAVDGLRMRGMLLHCWRAPEPALVLGVDTGSPHADIHPVSKSPRLESSSTNGKLSTGCEVDFLRRQPEGEDPHPFRFWVDEGDLWPGQAAQRPEVTRRRDLLQAGIVQRMLDEGLLASP